MKYHRYQIMPEDYVKPHERVPERRKWPLSWKVLPFIAALIALFLWHRDVRGETVRGVTKHGAFTCWYSQGPLLKFCYVLTAERR